MNIIKSTAIAITAIIGVQSAASAGTEVFADDFKGDALAGHWEVINEDADAYIVEDGALLSIASGGAHLNKGNVVNIFRLKQKMPKGDWTATMKFSMPYQTGRETPFLALYGDKDNFISAYSGAWSYYEKVRGARLFISSGKRIKGKSTSFSKVLWGGPKGVAFTAEDAPNPFILRITKKGRSYTAAVRIKKGSEATWSEDHSLTSLRQPGSLAFGIFQNEKVAGETPMSVDWVKIESAD